MHPIGEFKSLEMSIRFKIFKLSKFFDFDIQLFGICYYLFINIIHLACLISILVIIIKGIMQAFVLISAFLDYVSSLIFVILDIGILIKNAGKNWINMYTFLIVLGIYLIGVVYLHVSLYFDWIEEDKCGSTIGDLYSFYVDQDNDWIFLLIWVPVVNTIVLIIQIFLDIGSLFSKIKIR